MSDKVYLGDAVYAEIDDSGSGGLILTTENGRYCTNTVVLEPEVLWGLVRYAGEHCTVRKIVRQPKGN